MSWIILEGLDKTGKSTVAELYKNKGYDVVHLSAPSNKYKEPGYAGPSYVDDMLEVYLQHDNKDVVFDRSIYGEQVWPYVYGRDPMLSEDDIDMLREFEDRNQASRVLMVDPDSKSHWQRCVDNNEPINHQQFHIANKLFDKLAHKYNFLPSELKDYVAIDTDSKSQDASSNEEEKLDEKRQTEDSVVESTPVSESLDTKKNKEESTEKSSCLSQEEKKLEQANAINSVLSKRLIKQKGSIFDELESDIKVYLRNRLAKLLGSYKSDELSSEEIAVLKIFCKRLKEKQQNRG